MGPRSSNGLAPQPAAMPKVLVFENDLTFARELRNELAGAGCTVQVVEDGEHGLKVASYDPPDLILVAVELGAMTGFSVCDRIKGDPELRDVPVVVMSA